MKSTTLHNALNLAGPPLALQTRDPSGAIVSAERLHAASKSTPDARGAQGWFILAVVSLILAGFFALFLVVGRLPFIAPLITDAGLFKRCLVVHVNLSLLFWFGSFSAAIFRMLPVPAGVRSPTGSVSLLLAAAGVSAIMTAAFLPGTTPVLSNYIPFIDHPLFALGVILFLASLALNYLQPQLWRSTGETRDSFVPLESGPGLRVCALATLLAATTFAASWAATSRHLPASSFYELAVFGGGHVLQVANVAAMTSIWLLLVHRLQGRPVLGQRAAVILFSLLLAPHLVAPLLTIHGTSTTLYHHGFTQLMRWGIFPVVLILLVLCLRRLKEARLHGRLPDGYWRDPRFVGFSLSAGMTVLGFILGACIRSSSTLIPAHYHASIGAVTVAFMSVAYLLLQPFGLRVPYRLRRLIPWQLALFGTGQMVFALGFAIGGAFGLDRKAYASEQHVASVGEHLGIAVMGAGGLVATCGGILFLTLMIAAWLPQRAPLFSTQELKTSA